MTSYDEIMKEFKQEIAQGIELDDIKDRSYEYIDNYVPVYNNRIIEEWQDMPNDYDDRGTVELGIADDAGIISRMQLDLYLYYSDIVALVLDDLSSELESVE